MPRSRAHRALSGSLVLAVVLLAGCAAPVAPAGVEVSNGTTLVVTITVNGVAAKTVAPSATAAIPVTELPPLPWLVEARAPSGRVLTSMTVHTGDVSQTTTSYGGEQERGVAARVDLSCGRLDIWSGPPLIGPMPGPGTPGDCQP